MTAARLARLYTLHMPLHMGKHSIIAGAGAFEALHRLRAPPVVRANAGPRFAIHMPDMISRALFFCGVWEPTITSWMRHRLAAGDVFIDVGGNIGYHSCLAGQCVGPAGKVVAMEPSPSIGRLFADNVALNALTNVRLERCAVSDREGSLQVLRGPDGALGTTRTSVTHSDAAEATVAAHRLSDIVPHDLLFNARMVKIDVEGAESQVIAGIAEDLDRFAEHTEWIIELSPGSRVDTRAYIRDLLAPFEQVGYRAFAIDNRYDIDWYVRHARRLAAAAPETLLRALPANPEGIEQIDVILTRDPVFCAPAFSPPAYDPAAS